MENKKKPKTTLKEVKKKKTKMKQKQKQQQSNKQTVKLNITTSGGSGGSGGSQQQKPSYLPSSFGNQEQTTLLKSINEQLKQKIEPVATAPQNFNIPQPSQPTPQENGTEAERVENEMQGLPPQFSEKVSNPPIERKNEDIPIINKPVDTSNDNLIERATKKRKNQDDQNEVEQIQKEVEKETEQQKKEKEAKKLQNEVEQIQKEMDQRKKENKKEAKRQQKEELEKEMEQQKKENKKEAKRQQKEEERQQKEQEKEQQKKNKKQQISNNAFKILIDNSPTEKHNTLREAYENGFLTDVAIKKKLKELRTNATNVKSKKLFTSTQVDSFF